MIDQSISATVEPGLCSTSSTSQSTDAPMLSTKVVPTEDIKEMCVFCLKKDKRSKRKLQPLLRASSTHIGDTIRMYAPMPGYPLLEIPLPENDFDLSYHRLCRDDFISKGKTRLKYTDECKSASMEAWHELRDSRGLAFKKICSIVQTGVIDVKSALSVKYLCKLYDELTCENVS